MIAIGFVAAGFCNSLIEIFIYYGFFVGTGVGVGFNCAINIALKWFPDKQGVASWRGWLPAGASLPQAGALLENLVRGGHMCGKSCRSSYASI